MKSFIVIISFCSAALFGQASFISEKQIKPICDQLFMYHVDFQAFDEMIAKRSIKVLTDTMDSDHLYFLESELLPYYELSEKEISQMVQQYHQDVYAMYRNLFSLMEKNVARAREIRQGFTQRFIEQGFFGSEAQGSDLYRTVDHLQQKWEMRFTRFAQVMAEQEKVDLADPSVRKAIVAFFERTQRRGEDPYLAAFYKKSVEFDHYFSLTVCKTIAKSLDAHSSVYTPKEAVEIRTMLQKQFCGVGVALKEGIYGVKVADLVEGGPAKQSGKVQVGDRLAAIDGRPLSGSSFDEALDRLKGEPGTKVRLTLIRNGESRDVVLTRQQIFLEDELLKVKKVPFGDGSLAVLSFNSFYDDGQGRTLENDVKEAIKKVSLEGPLYGVVLDMRENGGGFLHQAIRLCALFIPQGVVVVAQYAHDEVESSRYQQPRPAYQLPVIVLTSKASASASEVVAQTLQDYGVAIVVGDERTYGKGTMQLQTITDPKAVVPFKVTVGRYYTISGRSTQLKGVSADLVVPTVYSPYLIGEKYLEYPLRGDALNFDPSVAKKGSQRVVRQELQNLFNYSVSARRQGLARYVPVLAKNSAERMRSNPEFVEYRDRMEKLHEALLHQGTNGSLMAPVIPSKDLVLEETVAILEEIALLQKAEREKARVQK